jgi:hypothetical protein
MKKIVLSCLIALSFNVFAENCLFAPENSQYLKTNKSVDFTKAAPSQITLEDINWLMEDNLWGYDLHEFLDFAKDYDYIVSYLTSKITGANYVKVKGYPGDNLVILYYEVSTKKVVGYVSDGYMESCDIIVPGM